MKILLLILFIPILAFGQVVRPPITGPTAPVLLGDIVTTAAADYFVETTGSDTNDCKTVPTACLTIQGALKKVPKRIAHPVTITVGAGSFGCAYLSDYHFDPPALGAATGAYLLLQGTLATSTLATGSATGTSTAAAGPTFNPMTFGTITDTGQAWTVNDLRGRFVLVGSTRRTIISNTATSLTYAGSTSLGSGAGLAYTVQDSSTVLTGTACDRPATGIAAQGTGGNSGMLFLSNPAANSYNSSTVAIRFMRFTNAVGRAIYLEDRGSAEVTASQFLTTASPILVDNAGSPGSRLTVTDSSFNLASGTAAITYNGTSPGSNILFVNGIEVSGPGAFGVNFFGRYANIGASSISLTGTANVPVSARGPTELNIQLNRFDCGSIASSVGFRQVQNLSSTTGWTPATASMNAVDISNCATGVLVNGEVDFTSATGAISGASNTTALSVERGGKLTIRSDTTITGTTQISLDGTPYTLTELRTQVPKRITDIGTLSTVSEP